MAVERLKILDSNQSNVLVKDGRMLVDTESPTTATGATITQPKSYSQLDQAKFTINGVSSDYDVSTNVSKAWDNVTTAKELTLYSDSQVEYKLNATATDGFILPVTSSVLETNIDITNIYITTTATTVLYLQLKGS